MIRNTVYGVPFLDKKKSTMTNKLINKINSPDNDN